jgi:hypothetical protein
VPFSTKVRAHIRGNAVGYLALFVALTIAPAWAAQIGGSDIKRNAIRSKHIKKGAVKTRKIAAAAVTMRKLAGNSVNSSKVVDRSLTGNDIDVGTLGNLDAQTVKGSDVNSSSFVTLEPPPTPDDPATTRVLFQSGPIVVEGRCDYFGDTTDYLVAGVLTRAPSEANIKLFRDGATFTASGANGLQPVLATDSGDASLKHVEQTMVLLTSSGYSLQGLGMAAIDLDGTTDTCSVRASAFGTPG